MSKAPFDPSGMDARKWAREFVKTVRKNSKIPLCFGAMEAWFATAIMAGYDKGHKAGREAIPRRKKKGRCLFQVDFSTGQVRQVGGRS